MTETAFDQAVEEIKARRLPFGFVSRYPVKCVKCGRATYRRITRDRGICLKCEDVPRGPARDETKTNDVV